MAPAADPTLASSPARLSGGSRDAPSMVWAPDVPTLLWSDPKDGGDGSYCLNADKGLVKWRFAPFRFQDRLFPVAMAANEEAEFNLQVGGGAGSRGDYQVGALMLTSTNAQRVAVRPYVASPFDKYLSNVLISANLMFGTAQLPALLPSPIYSLAKTDWRVTVRNLVAAPNTVSAVSWGRKFIDRGRELCADQRRKAELLAHAWPYWIGPQHMEAAFTGPQVTLLPGAQIDLRFPIPSFADFLARWILDDSTSTTGLEPLLDAQIMEDDTTRGLVDLAGVAGLQGLRWRDFMACPTVTIAGFPSGGVIRAASLGFPRGGWTHLFKRRSAIVVRFTSADPGTITLRTCFQGWLLNAEEPEGRHFSNDAQVIAERVAQARAAGSAPVRFFEEGAR